MNKNIKLVGTLFLAYLLLIGICLLIYILVAIPESKADKVTSIMGLLGWSATIFTPIAAFILLDNWKNQIKYNARLEQIINIIDELSRLSKQIDKVRNDPKVFSYLYKLFLAYEDYQDKDMEIFDLPDFTDIFQTLENIRVCNLKIYIYDEKIQSHIFQKKISGQDSYEKLERYIKGLEASFFHVHIHREEIDKGINSTEPKRHLQKCLYINSNFANAYRSSLNPPVDNIYLEQLNSAIAQSFEDIKIFRKSLN